MYAAIGKVCLHTAIAVGVATLTVATADKAKEVRRRRKARKDPGFFEPSFEPDHSFIDVAECDGVFIPVHTNGLFLPAELIKDIHEGLSVLLSMDVEEAVGGDFHATSSEVWDAANHLAFVLASEPAVAQIMESSGALEYLKRAYREIDPDTAGALLISAVQKLTIYSKEAA